MRELEKRRYGYERGEKTADSGETFGTRGGCTSNSVTKT